MMSINLNSTNLKEELFDKIGTDYSLLGELIYEADKHNYKEKPVTIEQFYTDPYYLGGTFTNDYE